MNDLKLTIELVPNTSWFTNLRSILSEVEWDKIRKKCYANAGYKCEICGGKGDKWPVECHEIWEYNDEYYTQKLTGLVSLCPSCHQVKHIGLAQMKGNYRKAINHFCKVNDKDKDFAENYVEQCKQLWIRRSKHKWELDISWLDSFKS